MESRGEAVAGLSLRGIHPKEEFIPQKLKAVLSIDHDVYGYETVFALEPTAIASGLPTNRK